MKHVYKKVILSGGFVSRASDGGAAFCAEVISGGLSPIRMLECAFGMPEESWKNSSEKDLAMFREMCPNVTFDLDIAIVEHFVEQIKQADIVYFRGGETQRLQTCLAGINGWQDALDGKVLVGASAGAYVLSSRYVQLSQPPDFKHGFGLLPVKIVAHYQSTFLHKGNHDKSKEYWSQVDKIMDNQDGLTVVKLREGEFVVI